MSFVDFTAQYKVIWRSQGLATRAPEGTELCKAILKLAQVWPEEGSPVLDVQLGRTKVFMRNPVFNALEHTAKRLQTRNAITVQTAARALRSAALVAVLRELARQRAVLCDEEAGARAALEGQWPESAFANARGAWEQVEGDARESVVGAEAAAFGEILKMAQAEKVRALDAPCPEIARTRMCSCASVLVCACRGIVRVRGGGLRPQKSLCTSNRPPFSASFN